MAIRVVFKKRVSICFFRTGNGQGVEQFDGVGDTSHRNARTASVPTRHAESDACNKRRRTIRANQL